MDWLYTTKLNDDVELCIDEVTGNVYVEDKSNADTILIDKEAFKQIMHKWTLICNCIKQRNID